MGNDLQQDDWVWWYDLLVGCSCASRSAVVHDHGFNLAGHINGICAGALAVWDVYYCHAGGGINGHHLFGTHGLFVLVLPAILQAVQPWQRRVGADAICHWDSGDPGSTGSCLGWTLYPLGVLLAAIVVCCGPSFLRLGEGIIANGFDGLKRIGKWREMA